jgi:hypothetical protein
MCKLHMYIELLALLEAVMTTLVRILRTKSGAAAAAVALVTAALIGGCGGSGSSDSSAGSLRLALTDAPACGFDAINVTIQRIRVHQSSIATPTDAGWSEIALTPARRIALLTLSNGVLLELGQIPLPAGNYTQMRLVLAANDTANPLANSVVPQGASEVALTTPSDIQTGLKMNIDIKVAANQMADFVLDFDACKSVVTAGASGKYLLKPVVSVVPRFISGLQGFVDAALANGNSAISLQQMGVVVKATVPDASGRFLLQPVGAGTYDLVITAPGHATGVVTNVVIAADTVTSISGSSNPLSLPGSATGTLAGKVTTGVTPIDATVDAKQPLSGGHTIEAIGAAVDSVSGAYSYSVPVGPPVVAPFAAAPATLNFAADTAAAGKCLLVATSGVSTKTAGPVNLAAGATVTTNFTFP